LQKVVYYTRIVKRRHQQETHKTVHIRQRNFRHIQNFKTENAPPGMSETIYEQLGLTSGSQKKKRSTQQQQQQQNVSRTSLVYQVIEGTA
jgi:hypothetical protein